MDKWLRLSHSLAAGLWDQLWLKTLTTHPGAPLLHSVVCTYSTYRRGK